jgi:hypothetical protein
MATAQPITDHEQIRKWAEERGARPSCVKGTGGKRDTGMIRLDFPGYSGKESLQAISWDDWFRSFDDNNLALVIQERTTRGQQSNFNKLVSRGGSDSATPRRSGTKRTGARGTNQTSATAKRRSAKKSSPTTAARGASKTNRSKGSSKRSTSTGGASKRSTSTRGASKRRTSSRGASEQSASTRRAPTQGTSKQSTLKRTT